MFSWERRRRLAAGPDGAGHVRGNILNAPVRLCVCRYALTGKEVVSILMQRLVKVDGKVRTDSTYPAGFMDVIDIEKTDEHFRLIYDSKGRFVTHRITKVIPRRAAGRPAQFLSILSVRLLQCRLPGSGSVRL